MQRHPLGIPYFKYIELSRWEDETTCNPFSDDVNKKKSFKYTFVNVQREEKLARLRKKQTESDSVLLLEARLFQSV